MPISKKVEHFLAGSSWIRKMFEEGEKLRAIHGADKVYDFTIGNPVMEPPQAFLEALQDLAMHPTPGMHGYMSNAGYPETREAIAQVLKEESGLSFGAEHIIMTVGAGGALNVALKTLLDPGDEVIVFKPFFVEYRFYVDNHGGNIVELPTTKDFKPDPQVLAKAITPKTKLIIINTPNNPTGVVYNTEDLATIQRICQEKEAAFHSTIYILSDEPYKKIVYDDIEVPSAFQHLDNAIVATSHSKDLALPGERIGYLAVSPKARDYQLLLEGMVFANRTLGYVNAPAMMQKLIAGLQRETVDVGIYQANRDLLYNHLTSLGFEMVKPSGAFYLFPRSPLPDDVAFIEKAKEYNILLVPGGGFGLPGYFRLSYCIARQTIENALPAFTKLAEELDMKKK